MLTAVAKSVDEKQATPFFYKTFNKILCFRKISLWITFGFWWKHGLDTLILFQFYRDFCRLTPSRTKRKKDRTWLFMECFHDFIERLLSNKDAWVCINLFRSAFRKGINCLHFLNLNVWSLQQKRRLKSLVKWGKNPLT